MENLTNEDVLRALGNMSVMELISLTRTLESKWNLKAEPVVQVQTPKDTSPVVAAQTEFNVVLASVPADKKMSVIKAVRELMGLGLKESKDLVESAPKVIKEGVSAEEADVVKAKLMEAGAVIEVK